MSHNCHACKSVPCPPAHLCCAACWSRVPTKLRRAVYRHYRPGQCQDKRPSPTWFAAAHAAIAAAREGATRAENAA